MRRYAHRVQSVLRRQQPSIRCSHPLVSQHKRKLNFLFSVRSTCCFEVVAVSVDQRNRKYRNLLSLTFNYYLWLKAFPRKNPGTLSWTSQPQRNRVSLPLIMPSVADFFSFRILQWNYKRKKERSHAKLNWKQHKERAEEEEEILY